MVVVGSQNPPHVGWTNRTKTFLPSCPQRVLPKTRGCSPQQWGLADVNPPVLGHRYGMWWDATLRWWTVGNDNDQRLKQALTTGELAHGLLAHRSSPVGLQNHLLPLLINVPWDPGDYDHLSSHKILWSSDAYHEKASKSYWRYVVASVITVGSCYSRS